MVRNCKKKERDFRGVFIFELKKDIQNVTLYTGKLMEYNTPLLRHNSSMISKIRNLVAKICYHL